MPLVQGRELKPHIINDSYVWIADAPCTGARIETLSRTGLSDYVNDAPCTGARIETEKTGY